MTQLKLLIEQQRFVEALYFGALQLLKETSAELHLYLGLACCGAIKPIAELERLMSDPQKLKAKTGIINGLIIPRDTTIVYEGLFHLIEARKKNTTIIFPESLEAVVNEVINDIKDYLSQEFHGYRSQHRKYDLRTVGVSALILLKKLNKIKTEINPSKNSLINSGIELLEELEKNDSADAEFINIR